MFSKVVVANRGAVAARVIRALKQLRIKAVAVYSEADADAPYLAEADEAYPIGPSPARDSYLNVDTIVRVVQQCGADGLHPGYGFLSENADFAQRIESIGCRFIGPSPEWLRAMGHKTHARDFARRLGLPVGVGTPVLSVSSPDLLDQADRVGFPLLVKPAAGGGGIGMIVARKREEVAGAVERAAAVSMRGFANAEVFLERYLERPRHIEFQLLGDRHGRLRHLFERDCSVQRRHQKVIEEARATHLDSARVDALARQLQNVFGEAAYDNLGTVEMLMAEDGSFHFLEMNTRLQVEHGVTEEITGVDLVIAQIRSAAGHGLDDILPAAIEPEGHAIQARVYAEDPKRFLPSPGKLLRFRPPSGPGIRVETGYAEGGTVSQFYDPMIAKVIAHAGTREAAIAKLRAALDGFEIEGPKTNLLALHKVLDSEAFQAGRQHTGLLAELV